MEADAGIDGVGREPESAIEISILCRKSSAAGQEKAPRCCHRSSAGRHSLTRFLYNFQFKKRITPQTVLIDAEGAHETLFPL